MHHKILLARLRFLFSRLGTGCGTWFLVFEALGLKGKGVGIGRRIKQ